MDSDEKEDVVATELVVDKDDELPIEENQSTDKFEDKNDEEVFNDEEAPVEGNVEENENTPQGMNGESEEEEEAETEKYNERKLTKSQLLKKNCYPQGLTIQAVPLALCLVALILTFTGSWDCSYFNGATISFTGNSYGLWTLEDIEGKCQHWDVLFFSYSLGAPMIAARIFSMACMLIGLGLVTTMCQAVQLHCVSWAIGLTCFILFMVSVTTSSIYNIWIIFFLFTYVIFILICRALFIHPVHRQISVRGNKIIASMLFLCGLCSILTLVVLKSDFCTCKRITAETLNGRDPGDPCEQTCSLGAAGYLCIVAAFIWFHAIPAVIIWGVQPPVIPDEELESMYADYPRHSIGTRMENTQLKGVKRVKEIRRKYTTSTQKSGDEGSAAVDGSNVSELTTFNKTQENGGSKVTKETGDMGVNVVIDEEKSDEEEEPFKRSCCQKFCCDYRVKERSRKERWAFWSFRVALGFLVGIYTFLVIILIGSRVENTLAAKAPDTSYNFITDVVCAFDPLDPSQPFETFETKEKANAANKIVAHCGACGFCSNPRDIEVYLETRKTIAKKAKECGPKALLGSYNSLVKCLEGKIGFTRDCTECWADNMKTTGTKCLFTCMVTMFTGFMSNNNVPGSGDQGWLNQCLFCDEKRSGPEFVDCSGVARRRLGIISEIERNPEEQCKNTDVDWNEFEIDQLL